MNAAAQILQRQSSDQQREHNTRALIESLTSQSEVLRWFAAEQLGVIQAPEAVNELKRLLDDDERKIRKAAKKAIKAIESAARARERSSRTPIWDSRSISPRYER